MEVLFTSVVQSRVCGPHEGKPLADKPDGILHRSSSVGEVTWRDSVIPPAQAEGLQEYDWVGHLQKVGVNINGDTKHHPDPHALSPFLFWEGTTLAATVSLARQRSEQSASWA